nr:reverse transcriptase domain-containing protein [Tanacetum cinerariifolium]
MEIQVGDRVMLKLFPWKGFIRFSKRGKLNPRYVGPFKVLEKVGAVAYKLELPQELSRVHNIFHVSNLKKCYADEPLAVLLDGLHIDDKLYFVEEPIEIIDSRSQMVKAKPESSSNPISTKSKHRNRIRSKPRVEPFSISIVTMADNRTMEEMLQVPTEGYGDAIVVPDILAENFEIRTSLLSLIQANQFQGFEEPPRSILTWGDLVSKFMNHLFPPSRTTHLKNEITRFTHKFEETFGEAWERFKEMLRQSLHHGFSELHQINTFYNGLNEHEQDSLNVAAGGNLLRKTPQDALIITENKSKVRYSRNNPVAFKVSTTSSGNSSCMNAGIDKLTNTISNLVETFNKKMTIPATVKAVEETCVICGGSGSLPSNAVPNPREDLKAITTWSGVTLDRPSVSPPPSKMKLPEKLGDPDKFLIPCDFPEFDECLAPADLGASIKLMPLSIWKNLSLPELTSMQMILELADRSTTRPDAIAEDIFVKVGKFHFLIDFVVVDYVADPHIPLILKRPILRTGRALIDVYGSGSLPSNAVPNPREDLKAITTWSGVTLDRPSVSPPPSKMKLPEKLGDPDKFLIPCDFPEFDECLAPADLGASIKLMPLSIWKNLSLPELTSMQMILELADRSTTRPDAIAEDIFVKVGKFHFLIDFVVVDYVADPHVPLILRRPILRTGRALIDVYGEELTIRVNDEAITFRGDFILEEIETFLQTPDELSDLDDDYYDMKGDILYLEKLLNEDLSPNLPPVKTEDLKQVDATMTKSSIEEPSDLELKELPSYSEYAIFEGTDKLPIIISKELKDEEKSTLLKV